MSYELRVMSGRDDEEAWKKETRNFKLETIKHETWNAKQFNK